MINNDVDVKKSRPEFVELLDAFNCELNYKEEMSSIIFEKVNTIKDVRELEKGEKNPTEEPHHNNGIINDLWMCINRMKKYNSRLNESKKALIRFIG